MNTPSSPIAEMISFTIGSKTRSSWCGIYVFGRGFVSLAEPNLEKAWDMTMFVQDCVKQMCGNSMKTTKKHACVVKQAPLTIQKVEFNVTSSFEKRYLHLAVISTDS
jgi:hypothetical protein